MISREARQYRASEGGVLTRRDRPMIFSAPMVRALLEGRKTQTRRVLKPDLQGSPYLNASYGESTTQRWKSGELVENTRTPGRPHTELVLPHVGFTPGDRLWVRETWQTGSGYAGPQIAYRATGDAHDIDAWDGGDEGAGPSFNYDRLPGLKWHTWLPDLLGGTEGSWRSPIHMPRALSRLTLLVERVRIQRLQDISRGDAIDEGIAPLGFHAGFEMPGEEGGARYDTARDAYAALWSSIHGVGAWQANPWVAALTFKVARQNIDSLPHPTGHRATDDLTGDEGRRG